MEGQERNRIFRAFEHASYNTRNEGKEGKILPVDLFEALKNFAGEKDLSWYTLTANGVRFHQFVGAIQIGRYCIEVLPKIDRTVQREESAQNVLIEMLKQSGFISVKTPTESNLRLKKNYILETYIRMFLDETWEIFHRGLVKYYRSEEGNNYSLKGNILFNRQISKNNIHAERFYVRFSIYDKEHPLNRILYKTLRLITKLSVSQDAIYNSISQLNLFPELKDIRVNDDLFAKIRFSRKTEAYRSAISIARLLLLNYHPDLSHGRNNVLALMFDMNDVWESWVTRRLILASRKYENIIIRAQERKTFWTGNTGERVRQKPDIIIEVDQRPEFILDTKWKIVSDRPSEDDLRQMFAYNRLFGTKQSFLVYPGEAKTLQGEFYEAEDNGKCGLFLLPFLENRKLSSGGVEKLTKDLFGSLTS